jgi:hypothetical protein
MIIAKTMNAEENLQFFIKYWLLVSLLLDVCYTKSDEFSGVYNYDSSQLRVKTNSTLFGCKNGGENCKDLCGFGKHYTILILTCRIR